MSTSARLHVRLLRAVLALVIMASCWLPAADGAGLVGTYFSTQSLSGTRVVRKYRINADNFRPGYVTMDDHWNNYWRAGQNRSVGWSSALPGNGNGAKGLGQVIGRHA